MDGTAREAIRFYEEVFAAKVAFRLTFGEMPGNPESSMADDVKERSAHAVLKAGESELMFSDTFSGHPHPSGNQVTICITTDDKEKAEHFYESLKQNGQVRMPM